MLIVMADIMNLKKLFIMKLFQPMHLKAPIGYYLEDQDIMFRLKVIIIIGFQLCKIVQQVHLAQQFIMEREVQLVFHSHIAFKHLMRIT